MIANYGRRFFAFLMALIMVFSMVPGQVFATETGDGHDHEGHTHEEQTTETTAPAVEPETTAPAVPETTTPVVPETTAPAVPETTAPMVPETTAPVVPETTAPVVPETTMPAVTEPQEAQQEIPSDWTEEMVKLQPKIDKDVIEYYLTYYGFEMPDEAKFGELIRAQISGETAPEALAAEWEPIRAQVEDIVLNKMDAGERENALMSIHEVEYMMAEELALTEQQCAAIAEANPVFLEFIWLIDEYAVAPSLLASGNFTVANGNIYISYSGGETADKGGKTSETEAWFDAWASGFYRGSTNTITVKNNSADKTAVISFNHSVTGDCSAFTIAGTSKGKTAGTYTSGELAPGASIELKLTGKGGFGGGTDPRLTLSAIVWTEVVANPEFTITFNAGLGGVTLDGTAMTSGSSQTVTAGASIALVATPSAGSQFLGWVDANSMIVSTAAEYTITAAGDVNLQAVFAKDGGTPWFGVGSTEK